MANGNVTTAQGRTEILKTLTPSGTALGSVCCDAVMTLSAGGPEADKAAKNAFYNASLDLRQRGVIVNNGPNIELTEAGKLAAAGGPLPPAPVRQPKAAPVAVAAPAAVETVTAPVVATVTETTPVVAEAPVDAPVAEVPAATAAEVPAPPAKGKRRLKVADAPATVESPDWYQDEALRSLVADQTDCFGAWSARAPSCGECELAGWCRNAKAASYTLLANKVLTETPAAPVAVKETVAKLDAAISAANAPDAKREAPVVAGATLRATHDGTCAHTGNPIRKGDPVKFVRGTGLVLLV